MSHPPPRKVGSSHQEPSPDAPTAGLDAERHRRSQAAARDAEVLRLAVVPGLVAAAAGIEKYASTPGLSAFVDQVAASVGDGSDPCVRMLAEQTVASHFRSLQLHALAAASSAEANAILTRAAAKLSAEVRQSVLAMRTLPAAAPKPKRNTPELRVAGG